MAEVIVDGKTIEIGDHERLNGIQVARLAGVDVPHYCWHAGLSVVASCRMCLVETGTRNAETGQITMMPKLVPACQTPATNNTVFVTQSEKIAHSRALVEECLLIDHPIDCPICDKAGECNLQDYHFKYGQEERRADVTPFTSRRREMGPTVTLFVDRCVMCTRCVRFTREISGTKELMVIDRGAHDEIDVFPGYPLANKLSGNVVDLCPVGALGDKDFLYQQRVWFMRKHDGVCTGCSTGCSITVEENQDHVYRLKPRENPEVNGWWMCDEGRYGYHHVHSHGRLEVPERRNASGYEALDWSLLLADLPARIRKAGRLGVAISPHLTVEEAYLLAQVARQIDPGALLVLGPVPHVGEDERFPKNFVIHAEKCPNRRGVEEVLKHFSDEVATFERLVQGVEAGDIQAAWLSGGYKSDWIDGATAERLAQASELIVQDQFTSPAWERASVRLPGASFAEREGSYVNFADQMQWATRAIRPPAGVRVEGGVYWQMAGRMGLYQPKLIFQEITSTIPFFAPAASGLGANGVKLAAENAATAHK
jgi:NADH-quinone oxidoreductase subunit G